ncbi:uncharacterized protein isoform X3 [Takifugu rubripes]|uniref:uncharacterized protein isoform X3 n=1 Tax=Takifugu rubripes TaxID=31033 RepID=UPI001145B3CA|nr:uncharacterized protein LOC105416823 isoform X3 [Takifugu rubripes]
MPTAKRERTLMSRRYQLAARNDDATLAQKRQYWRNKKREQRARLKCTLGKKINPQSAAVPNSKPPSQLHVAVQKSSVGKVQHMAQISFRIQPKHLSTSANAGMIHISPDAPAFVQMEDRVMNTTPQTGTKSALITAQRAKGVDKSRSSLETEERAAKRREHWRIKKREQRAKLAARLKWREVTPGVALQRQAAQQTGLIDGAALQGLTPKPLLRGGGHKQYSSDDKLQPGGEGLAPVISQEEWIKAEKPNSESKTQGALVSEISLRKRKLPSCADLSNVSSGISQYKTPRQRLAEAQRNLMSQRNSRRKTALQRGISKMEPSNTYEQVIAKQREYWRLKKREQRAKLSFKGKIRLKENYSKTIKLHQHLQEDKAGLGNARIPVPETIGGFIKEDGTVTVNVPAQNTDGCERKEEPHVCSESNFVKKTQSDKNWRSLAPVHGNPAPPPPRVKVTAKRPHCRPSVRSTNQPEGAEVSHLHSAAQTVGTFIINPLTPQNGGLNLGGCVLKMAVSNSGSLAPSVDAPSTEKERIARKREYWRLKKREQRAACAARMKHSLLQARTVLEKKNGPQQLSWSIDRQGGSPNGHFPDNSMEPMPNRSQTKDERQSQYSQTINATSDGIKLPPSPEPHPVAQPEPELDLTPDRNCEISPESVKSEIKTEAGDESLELDVAPDFTVMVFEEKESFINPDLKAESESSATISYFPSSCEEALNPICEHSFQDSMNAVNGAEPSISPEDQLPRIFDKNLSHQINSSPEPPTLCQPPFDILCRHQCQEADLCQIKSSSAQTGGGTGTKQSGLTGLLKQREYWKLIKRQQRARLRARKSQPRGECSNPLSQRNTQAADLDPGMNPLPLQHEPLFAAPNAVSGSPTAPDVNPATCNGWPSDNHQNQQEDTTLVQKTTMPTNTVDDASCLSVLEPPANPLCRISLQPTEPPPGTSDYTPLPAEIPCALFQTPAYTKPNNPAPVTTMVPPKHIPGEREEDFLRRKREYWRIKKKEQRAKKAIQDKVITLNRASTDIPNQNIQTQCVISSEESDHLISTLLDADVGSFPYYTAPVEDESELQFGASEDGEDSPVPDKTWRSCYLMDYDPLNHLLVCIVCGEMQYPPSLTRVRAHIDEAHPDSLTMPPMEKQQILAAWDEEVSRRERFFTSQLQRHSGMLADNSNEDK